MRLIGSFFGAAPIGEQKKKGKGWDSKGPAVCTCFNSFKIAVETVSLLESTKRLFRSGPEGGGPEIQDGNPQKTQTPENPLSESNSNRTREAGLAGKGRNENKGRSRRAENHWGL